MLIERILQIWTGDSRVPRPNPDPPTLGLATMTHMAPTRRPYDVLLRAVHSATSELELVDIRALLATHCSAATREEIDGAIANRRRALELRDRPALSGRSRLKAAGA